MMIPATTPLRLSGSLAVAWTGAREYGLAQIQEPRDVLKAMLGLVLIGVISSPGVFGVWQAVRPTLVANKILDDSDEAIDAESNVLLFICASLAAYVVSECLDCGH